MYKTDIIDLDLLEEIFPIREIASNGEDWWDEFIKELKFRKYKVKKIDKNMIYLDRKLLKRIKINYNINKNDVWIYLTFTHHFLYPIFIFLAILPFIIIGLSFIMYSIMPIISTINDLYYMISISGLIGGNCVYNILLSAYIINYGRKINPTISYRQRQKHVHEIKKAAQQSSDKIKREYFKNIYRYERVKLGECPGCGEKVEKNWSVCPICRANLIIDESQIPKYYQFEYLTRIKYKSYQFYQKSIDFNGDEELFEDLKNIIFNELKMRGFKLKVQNDKFWAFKTSNDFNIKLFYNINDKKIIFKPKVKVSSKFILILIISLSIYLILQFTITPLICITFSKSIFEQIIFIVMDCMLIMSPIVVIITTFTSPKIYDIPAYPNIRYFIQKSLNFGEKIISSKIEEKEINKLICPSCKKIIRPTWKICGYCGFKLKEG
ncbi:MAG: zinc ribbon domain-containing protein [Candidatus Helarchaeota archaeon]